LEKLSLRILLFLNEIINFNLLYINYFIFLSDRLFIDDNCFNGDWGLGIGDWGLGIGDWAQSPIPNPQSPIPIKALKIIKFTPTNFIFN
jgi:hypothetical protein